MTFIFSNNPKFEIMDKDQKTKTKKRTKKPEIKAEVFPSEIPA